MRVLLLVASLAACAPERSEEAREIAAEVEVAVPEPSEAGGLPAPPPPPPRVPPLPGLVPLGEAEVAAALGSGASCALMDGKRMLMVATVGAAVINDRGTIVRLAPQAKDWEALAEGGRFTGGGITIEVDPGAVVGRGVDLVERDSSVSLMRGRRGFSVSHGPVWACGS